MKIEIVNLCEKNVDDALLVCTSPKLRDDENVKIGLEIRKNWLLDLCRKLGSCAKIAYIKDKPAGMIQCCPLHTIPYFKTNRRDVLYIHCIYVKRNLRNRGVGSALLEALINDMKKPNELFEWRQCRLLSTSARERYGFRQVSYFKHRGFIKTKGNIDVALIYPLAETSVKESLDIPPSEPLHIREKRVKIFFNPSCQYCKYTNESIKTKIREVNPTIKIEEYNLWTHYKEALRTGITCVATYINGKPVLPLPPQRFCETIKRLSLQTN